MRARRKLFGEYAFLGNYKQHPDKNQENFFFGLLKECVAEGKISEEFLRNEMAQHEYEIAVYYHDRGAMLAAINRIKYLIEHFDGAPIVDDGLALMAQAYDAIGMSELASDTRRVLGQNNPEHAALSTTTE